MKGALAEVVATLSHLPGVMAAMIVGAAAGGIDSRKHTAALAAYLYSKITRASDAARLGTPAFMRLEAERGQVCVVGAGDVVLVTIVTSDANLGRVRLDMMKASQGKS